MTEEGGGAVLDTEGRKHGTLRREVLRPNWKTEWKLVILRRFHYEVLKDSDPVFFGTSKVDLEMFTSKTPFGLR